MKPSWTVDEALAEVVKEIDFGALGLAVNGKTRDSLKKLYRKDFERRYDEGADWNVEKSEVIPLCHLVGAGAETLTICRIDTTIGSVLRGELDEKSVFDSAKIVARVHCRVKPDAEAEPRRKWCEDVARLDLFLSDEAVAALVEAIEKKQRMRREAAAARRSAAAAAGQTPTWTVEGALLEVVNKINQGATPTFLSLDRQTIDGLTDLYYKDFAKQHQQGADWDREKPDIFRLCLLIGSGSGALTRLKGGTPPYLDEESVYQTAIWVAKLHCSTRRKWCGGVASGVSRPRFEPRDLTAAELAVLEALLH